MAVADAIESRNLVSSSANNFFKGANKATGRQPDLTWENVPGIWADLTTSGSWSKHVRTYATDFGEGIPLLYERGVGLVDTTRLYSGAGVIFGGSQTGISYFSNSPAGGSGTQTLKGISPK